MAKLTPRKAKIMMKESRARGRKTSKKQRGYFGLIAGGRHPRRGR